ncbi:annexin A13 [Tetranychus urticae]|uniref:Annexin n=1 Tax=Tetranychus urticae TaxID=32264 RepID=T1KDI1_TETUR|nr:annexin A13 [Tetranychus urticae]
MSLIEEARCLEKALFQSGNNNHLIVDILTRLNSNQRLILNSSYRQIFHHDLIEDIQAELGGLFEDACVALLKPYTELACDIIYQSLVGDKFTLLPIIDVFFTHNNDQLNLIRQQFIQKYGDDMNEYLINIPDANLFKITARILNIERETTDHVDLYLAYEEVDQLNSSGLGLSWTRQNEFLDLLCTRNFNQLQLTLQIYERVTGDKLEDDIRRYFDGDLHDIFSAIVSCIRCPVDYFAERIRGCLKAGNNDQNIINIFVTRSEIDLPEISRRYTSLFRKQLKDEIRTSMRGDFRKLLLALIRASDGNS